MKKSGIDQYGGHLLATSEGHDRVGAHSNVSATSQVCDELCTPSVVVSVFGPDDPHSFAVEFEIDFGVGKKARLLTNFGGDGHLAL
jgi:hypothetical protein